MESFLGFMVLVSFCLFQPRLAGTIFSLLFLLVGLGLVALIGGFKLVLILLAVPFISYFICHVTGWD